MPLKGGGGGGRLMANAILNFHFDYLNPSLSDIIHIDHIHPLHNIAVDNDFLKNGVPYPLDMASLPTFNHLLLPTNHTVPTLHLIYLLKMIKTINIIKSK